MTMKMTMAEFVGLEPCPFCGGEAETIRNDIGVFIGCFNEDCPIGPATSTYVDGYATEAEAIAAWNSRAPIEYDGWFYLPKPKEGIVDYGEPEITRTENGYKVRQIADVVDEAARKWGEELGEYVMQRICEIWNSRAERTCEFNIKDNMNETEGMGDVWIECSTCHCVFDYFADDWLMKMSYCPNCGCKVVS